MSEHDEFSDLTNRLRALSDQNVSPDMRQAHLAAMAAAPRGSALRPRWTKARVGLAFFAGLIIGGSGLATAGALPGPAQDVAHDVFGAVGIGVPRSQDDCVPAKEEGYKNHGEYVSEVAKSGDEAATQAAAKSECGKPIKGAGAEGADAGEKGAKASNPCRPPWAGGGNPYPGLTAEERREQRAQDQATWAPPAECDDEAEVTGESDDAAETQGEPAEPAVPAVPAEPAEPDERGEPGGDPIEEDLPAEGDGA